MKPRKIKSCWWEILTLHETKNRIFQQQYQGWVKMCIYLSIYIYIYIYLFHDWFPLEFVFIYSISLMYRNLQEFIKRKSKIQEKNMSCQHVLNFDQWKTFSENYKLIRAWLWLFYKFTDNNCRLRLFSVFIQTQKSYPISLDKTTCHIKSKFSK